MPRKSKPVKISIVRYALPDGTRCNSKTPGAVKHVEESETWFANVEGDRISLETRDESQAWINLRNELKRRADRKLGITDEYTDHLSRPIEEHRDAWLGVVEAEGTSADQIALLKAHLTALCKLAGWKKIGDITAESCSRALGRLQKIDKLAAQTRDHYTRHAKQFTRWLTDNDRLPRDPLRSLKLLGKTAIDADRKLIHRLPTDAEMARLFGYLESGTAATHKSEHKVAGKPRGPRQRIADGRLRALVYKVGMATGFRANEMRNLTREGIDLAAATATCQAGYSKRRRKDVQPLPPWLVAELREWFDGGRPWERIPTAGGKMLQADLREAGIEYETPAGSFTLHSLRVYYITHLANDPAVSPKRLFELARHSDPKLTLSTYAKVIDQRELHQDVARAIRKPGEGSGGQQLPPDPPAPADPP